MGPINVLLSQTGLTSCYLTRLNSVQSSSGKVSDKIIQENKDVDSGQEAPITRTILHDAKAKGA